MSRIASSVANASQIGTGNFSDGSLSAPSIAFQSQTNTGFYKPATNQIAMAANGVQIFVAESSLQILRAPGSLVQGNADDWGTDSSVASVSQAVASRICATSNTNNAIMAIGAYVVDGSNNRRIHVFVDDLNASAGIRWSASSGVPTFYLIAGGTVVGSISSAGLWTIGETSGTQQHRINIGTQTTVGAAGGASALPATPTGYLQLNVNGTLRAVPFYASA